MTLQNKNISNNLKLTNEYKIIKKQTLSKCSYASI